MSKWSIASGRGDFIPAVTGAVILFMSAPGLLMMVISPDHYNSGHLGSIIAVLLALGCIIGLAFLFHGLRLCASPGSLIYRVVYGRIFWNSKG